MNSQISDMPYIPEGGTIKFVPLENEFMQAAKNAAESLSLDAKHPTGAVVVMDGEITGIGANDSEWHENNECERKLQGIPTGKGYDLCEGCHPRNHAEPSAIRQAEENGKKVAGADLYLWGHWWCCKDCWNVMISAGIRDVYLVDGAREMFYNKR